MSAIDDDAQATGGGVRLVACPDDTYRLTIDGVTLALAEAQLALLGRAIHVMARRRPALLQRLIAETVADDSRPDDVD